MLLESSSFVKIDIIKCFREYRSLRKCCPDNNYLQYCNFSSYIGYKSDGTAYPIQTGNSEHDNCANEVFKIALTDLFDIG